MYEGTKDNICSEQWEQLKRARANYQSAIFDWCHLDHNIKRHDLLQEINGPLQAQLEVTEFLQSTEMWDISAIEAVASELVKEALDGQEEVAAWSIQALKRLKNRPIRNQIVKEIWQEAEQAKKSSWWIFRNGYLLLYYLGCKKELFRFIHHFHTEIGEEIDEQDWRDFENMMEE